MHFIGTNLGRLHETSGFYSKSLARTRRELFHRRKMFESRGEREFPEYVEEASWCRRTIAVAFADERET